MMLRIYWSWLKKAGLGKLLENLVVVGENPGFQWNRSIKCSNYNNFQEYRGDKNLAG